MQRTQESMFENAAMFAEDDVRIIEREDEREEIEVPNEEHEPELDATEEGLVLDFPPAPDLGSEWQVEWSGEDFLYKDGQILIKDSGASLLDLGTSLGNEEMIAECEAAIEHFRTSPETAYVGPERKMGEEDDVERFSIGVWMLGPEGRVRQEFSNSVRKIEKQIEEEVVSPDPVDALQNDESEERTGLDEDPEFIVLNGTGELLAQMGMSEVHEEADTDVETNVAPLPLEIVTDVQPVMVEEAHVQTQAAEILSEVVSTPTVEMSPENVVTEDVPAVSISREDALYSKLQEVFTPISHSPELSTVIVTEEEKTEPFLERAEPVSIVPNVVESMPVDVIVQIQSEVHPVSLEAQDANVVQLPESPDAQNVKDTAEKTIQIDRTYTPLAVEMPPDPGVSSTASTSEAMSGSDLYESSVSAEVPVVVKITERTQVLEEQLVRIDNDSETDDGPKDGPTTEQEIEAPHIDKEISTSQELVEVSEQTIGEHADLIHSHVDSAASDLESSLDVSTEILQVLASIEEPTNLDAEEYIYASNIEASYEERGTVNVPERVLTDTERRLYRMFNIDTRSARPVYGSSERAKIPGQSHSTPTTSLEIEEVSTRSTGEPTLQMSGITLRIAA